MLYLSYHTNLNTIPFSDFFRGVVCLLAKTYLLASPLKKVLKICVVTNGALRFSCVVSFETTHFFVIWELPVYFKEKEVDEKGYLK